MRTRAFNRRTGLAALSAAAMFCATGCISRAAMVHTPLRTAVEDRANRGIRYYREAPYLIAYTDGKGGLVTKIEYLPDRTQLMSARPDTLLADVASTMDFTNGVLTKSEDVGDASAVPAAIVKAVEAFSSKLLALANEAQQHEYTVPAPFIFRIVVSDGDVYFHGGQGSPDTFKISLRPQKEQ